MLIGVNDWKYGPNWGLITQKGNKLYTESTRLRAYLDIKASLVSAITVKFTILGTTDVTDGTTTAGLFIWTNWQDICNTYLIGARTDTTKPGKTIIKAQKKLNPGETNGTVCAGLNYTWLAGVGYTLLDSPYIANGQEHELKVVKLDATKWNVFLDGTLINYAEDTSKVFPDGKLGLRTDNVKMEFTYDITTTSTPPPTQQTTPDMLYAIAGVTGVVILYYILS